MYRITLLETPYPILAHYIIQNKEINLYGNLDKQTVEYTPLTGKHNVLIKIDECTYVSMEGNTDIVNSICSQLDKAVNITYINDGTSFKLYDIENVYIDFWWGFALYITNVELSELLLETL